MILQGKLHPKQHKHNQTRGKQGGSRPPAFGPSPSEIPDSPLKSLDANLIRVLKGEELQLSHSCTIYLSIFLYYLGDMG